MITRILDDARAVITKPADFYRNMPKSGGFGDPLVFVVVMGAITGVIVAIMSLVGLGGAAGMGIAGGVGLIAIITMPIFAIIGSFIGAAIMFVIWRLMGSEQSFETGYRCVAYASAIYPITTLLALVPYVGSLLGLAWMFYLMYVASIEVHGIAARTAMIVLGIIVGLLALLNIATERASRDMQANMEQFGKSFGDAIGQVQTDTQDMTPEEAGRAFGEFLKGLEQAGREAEQAQSK